MSTSNNLEIERKFLIAFPDIAWLDAHAEPSEIVQTYLVNDEGFSERVRKRGNNGDWRYYYTTKKRLHGFTRMEMEQEVAVDEYEKLLQRADPERNTIEKRRYCLPYEGRVFEVDIFPFWQDRAIMEIELPDENSIVEYPPEIRIIRELTYDNNYTNSALAKNIIYEDIK